MPNTNIRKIGVILDTLGNENTAALRYAILHLNTLQNFAEFEIIYNTCLSNEFIEKCSKKKSYNQDEILDLVEDFEHQVENTLNHNFDYVKNPEVCDRYLAICNCTLSNNYYLIGTGGRLRMLCIGAWETAMAPPSLLEFIIHQCLLQGARSSFPTEIISHFQSRGCLFDFNMTLENCRNSVLTGYICSDCREVVTHSNNLKELQEILGGKWLGAPDDPLSAYSELRRLGHSPFQSSRVRQTWWEWLTQIAGTKFVEEVVKYCVMAILLYVALSIGLQPLVAKL